MDPSWVKNKRRFGGLSHYVFFGHYRKRGTKDLLKSKRSFPKILLSLQSFVMSEGVYRWRLHNHGRFYRLVRFILKGWLFFVAFWGLFIYGLCALVCLQFSAFNIFILFTYDKKSYQSPIVPLRLLTKFDV